jgi:hypothetical protein
MKILAAGAVVMLLALAPTAQTAAPPAVDIEVEGTGTLVSGGTSVDVPLSVACHPRYTVLEANLSVSQGSASGFGGFGVPRCNNRPHGVVARVTSFGEAFVSGAALASAFVLVIRQGPSGETSQDQDVETIQLGS